MNGLQNKCLGKGGYNNSPGKIKFQSSESKQELISVGGEANTLPYQISLSYKLGTRRDL